MDQGTKERKIMNHNHLVHYPPNVFHTSLATAMENYLVHGYMPGSFLTAVLTNNLMGAVGSADSTNSERLPVIVGWIMNSLPSGSYGKYDLMQDWCRDKDGRRSEYVKRIEDWKVWNILCDDDNKINRGI